MRPPLTETPSGRVDSVGRRRCRRVARTALRAIAPKVGWTTRSANLREVSDHVPAIFDAVGCGLRECRSPEASVASPSVGSRDAVGCPVPGLFAADEIAGMTGGRINGRAALDGTMLGPGLSTGQVVDAILAGSPPRPRENAGTHCHDRGEASGSTLARVRHGREERSFPRTAQSCARLPPAQSSGKRWLL